MRTLTCSCCGAWMRGEQDPDNDVGYGTCQSCEEWIEEKFLRPNFEDMRDKLAAALNPVNREKFLAMPEEAQIALLGQAAEDGIFTYSIRRGSRERDL